MYRSVLAWKPPRAVGAIDRSNALERWKAQWKRWRIWERGQRRWHWYWKQADRARGFPICVPNRRAHGSREILAEGQPAPLLPARLWSGAGAPPTNSGGHWS